MRVIIWLHTDTQEKIPQNKVVALGKSFSKCELKSIIFAPFFFQRVILEVVLRWKIKQLQEKRREASSASKMYIIILFFYSLFKSRGLTASVRVIRAVTLLLMSSARWWYVQALNWKLELQLYSITYWALCTHTLLSNQTEGRQVSKQQNCCWTSRQTKATSHKAFALALMCFPF